MPPNRPTLTLSRLSSTSLRITLQGDSGTTLRTYYRRLGLDNTDTVGPTLVGPGPSSLTLSGLTAQDTYLVTAVADDGSSYSLPSFAFCSLADTTTVVQAALAAWNSTPTLLSTCGRLFNHEVPETVDGVATDLPYATVTADKSVYEWTFETSYVEIQVLDFCCYAAGAALAEASSSALKNAFSWGTLPFPSPAACIHVRPLTDQLTNTMTPYRDGSKVYRADVSFEVAVQRYLPGPAFASIA